jgi:hypothetical protein
VIGSEAHVKIRLALCYVLIGWTHWATAAELKHDELVTYQIPNQLLYSHHVDDFTVRVRTPGGAWVDLYEYRVKVDQDTHSTASVVQFDFRGEVEVAVQKNNGDFRRVALRPAQHAPKPTAKNGVVYFTLDRPRNLSVEFDGDRLHNLHVLAGAPIARPPPGPDVVFYEAGVHTPSDGSDFFPVQSGQTIYVAGGAVLQGTFKPENVENVRILGRGMIDRPREQLVVHGSRNVSIEGLTFLTPQHGTIACSSSSQVRFADIKTFSDGKWSDGINVFACKDVDVERAFVRTSDDSVAIYATRKRGVGDTERIRIKESTFWPDVAHAMFVGLHGNDNLVADVHFDNIDVLNLDEDDPEYQGVMAISAGDSNTVRNISFRNVRVDYIEEGKLFNVRVVFNNKYSFSPGKAVEGVLFEDIFYTGGGWAGPSVIGGFSDEQRVSNIVFDNVRIGGRKWRGREELEIGNFVGDVSFR